MEDFGARLRKLRRNSDLSQSDLAEQVGVVPSAIGKYERIANSYPSIEVLLKLADFFNVTTDYLLRGIQPFPAVENNINGDITNSPFIQANSGNVVLDEKELSPEVVELLHIYEALSGRERLNLLNFAVSLERKQRRASNPPATQQP